MCITLLSFQPLPGYTLLAVKILRKTSNQSTPCPCAVYGTLPLPSISSQFENGFVLGNENETGSKTVFFN